MGKVIIKLMKNFKSLPFHYNVLDDIIFFTHDTQHCPELIGESTAQEVDLAWSYRDKGAKLKITNRKQIISIKLKDGHKFVCLLID